MLEINRKLYLEEPTNNKLAQYDQIKAITADYMRELQQSI